MKRCPNCNQTFEEDWLSFCTQDGTTLIDDPAESSGPPPTMMAPLPPDVAFPNELASWNPPAGNVSPPPSQWQPPPPPSWEPPPLPPVAYGQPSKSLATAAMVIGIISVTVGWLCMGPVPAILAIVLGGIALSQIKKNPERVTGKQAAWVGIITGGLTVLIYAIFLVIYLVAIVASNT
ncbi:MAG TPA: DUF4190 domain-containing protein [Pyrinomonadaceae bacterium]|nr:DUF4190 domain-containing protein [Pyrinomonadaceae bacterium]